MKENKTIQECVRDLRNEFNKTDIELLMKRIDELENRITYLEYRISQVEYR